MSVRGGTVPVMSACERPAPAFAGGKKAWHPRGRRSGALTAIRGHPKRRQGEDRSKNRISRMSNLPSALLAGGTDGRMAAAGASAAMRIITLPRPVHSTPQRGTQRAGEWYGKRQSSLCEGGKLDEQETAFPREPARGHGGSDHVAFFRSDGASSRYFPPPPEPCPDLDCRGSDRADNRRWTGVETLAWRVVLLHL